MGMGRGTQNASSGMQGKGGAARPNPVQRPVQQPTAGMGGKGVGQPPAQQPNLNNALSGLAGAPVQTYPFPQRPVQQPTAGMGGKGVGQQPVLSQPQLDIINSGGTVGMGGKGVGAKPLDPLMQPYVNAAIGQPTQGQLDALNAAYAYQQGTPTKPAAGMGGKGVGQGQPDYAGQRAAFDAANPQPVPNPMNDPYAARFGVPGDYVGTPAPVQQPVAGMGGKGVGAKPLDPLLQPYVNAAIGRPINSYDDFPMINRTQPNSAPVLSPQEQDLAARQAFEAMQAQRQVQPAPVQQAPSSNLGSSLMGLGLMPPAVSPAPTTTQIVQPRPQQEAQRAIQRFGSVRRGRLGRR
jgi:hypothetical protein